MNFINATNRAIDIFGDAFYPAPPALLTTMKKPPQMPIFLLQKVLAFLPAQQNIATLSLVSKTVSKLSVAHVPQSKDIRERVTQAIVQRAVSESLIANSKDLDRNLFRRCVVLLVASACFLGVGLWSKSQLENYDFCFRSVYGDTCCQRLHQEKKDIGLAGELYELRSNECWDFFNAYEKGSVVSFPVHFQIMQIIRITELMFYIGGWHTIRTACKPSAHRNEIHAAATSASASFENARNNAFDIIEESRQTKIDRDKAHDAKLKAPWDFPRIPFRDPCGWPLMTCAESKCPGGHENADA